MIINMAGNFDDVGSREWAESCGLAEMMPNKAMVETVPLQLCIDMKVVVVATAYAHGSHNWPQIPLHAMAAPSCPARLWYIRWGPWCLVRHRAGMHAVFSLLVWRLYLLNRHV